MTTYNKLVRDKTPEIIAKSGKKAVIRVLTEWNYYKLLVKKLEEETNQFVEYDDVEDLADILEVVEALVEAKGISWDELIRIKESKKEGRGKLKKEFFLEEVTD